jgi:hypothetical protein
MGIIEKNVKVFNKFFDDVRRKGIPQEISFLCSLDGTVLKLGKTRSSAGPEFLSGVISVNQKGSVLVLSLVVIDDIAGVKVSDAKKVIEASISAFNKQKHPYGLYVSQKEEKGFWETVKSWFS